MNKQVKQESGLLLIPITKATLALYESELIRGLDAETMRKGLQRGKGVLRRRQREAREIRPAQARQGY